MRIIILVRKFRSYLLAPIKVVINYELSCITMNYTYKNILESYRRMFNHSTRHDMIDSKRTMRRINEVQIDGTDHGCRHGRVQGRHNEGIQIIFQGRGQPIHTHTNNYVITLSDGKKILYHPSFNFPY